MVFDKIEPNLSIHAVGWQHVFQAHTLGLLVLAYQASHALGGALVAAVNSGLVHGLQVGQMIGPFLGTFGAEAGDGIRRVKLHTAITAENVAEVLSFQQKSTPIIR